LEVEDPEEEPEPERTEEDKIFKKTIYVFYEDIEKIYVSFPGFQFKVPINSNEAEEGYTLKHCEDSNPERSQGKDEMAIDRLDKIDTDIRDCITGFKQIEISTQEELNEFEDETFNDDEYVSLNGPQKLSIKNIFLNKFTLIQGPPGTGKTTTAAVAIKLLLAKYAREASEAAENAPADEENNGGDENEFGKKNRKKKERSSKILVCSDSNKAVDNLAIELLGIGVKVIRIRSNLAKLREYDHLLDKIHLHKIQQRENCEEILEQS
jgi:hypothetical protein